MKNSNRSLVPVSCPAADCTTISLVTSLNQSAEHAIGLDNLVISLVPCPLLISVPALLLSPQFTNPTAARKSRNGRSTV